jgi:hypothetical protein
VEREGPRVLRVFSSSAKHAGNLAHRLRRRAVGHSVVDHIAGSKWKQGAGSGRGGPSASDNAGRASAGITKVYIGPRCRPSAEAPEA